MTLSTNTDKSSWRILLCAAAILVFGPLSNGITSYCSAAASPRDEAVFKKVASLYAANRAAVRSVECNYIMFLNRSERRCRYARDGEAYYHASVNILTNGRSMPVEKSWDCPTARYRRSMGYFVRSSDIEYAQPSCPVPDSGPNQYVDLALGFVKREGHQFRFQSAREIKFNGLDCIELDFKAESYGSRLITRHARTFGYLPVSAELYDEENRLAYELSEVSYEEREVDGNLLVYPVRCVQRTWSAGAPGNTIVFEVDRESLHLNKPVDRSRFAIEPWPCDMVMDMDTRQTTRAADPTWTPRGKVGFPYDVFFENAPPELGATPMVVAASPGVAAAQRGPTNAPPPPPPPVPVALAPPTDYAQLFWRSVLILGMMLVMMGVLWVWQRRRTA